MDQWKNLCDAGILCAVAGWFVGLAGPLAAVLAAVLTVMRIIVEWDGFKAKCKEKLQKWRD